MSMLPFTQSIAAGATYNPVDGWIYEFIPRPGIVKIMMRAAAVGLVATVTSGADTLMEESNVQAGGVAGVTPSELNTPPLVDAVDAGDRLKIRIRNPTGGPVVVDGLIDYTG